MSAGELGRGSARAHLRRDERDGLGVVEPQPAREPALRDLAGLREAQVVELARGEVHRTLLRYADGGVLEQRRAPRGAVAERRRDRDPHFRRSAPRSR